MGVLRLKLLMSLCEKTMSRQMVILRWNLVLQSQMIRVGKLVLLVVVLWLLWKMVLFVRKPGRESLLSAR